MQAFDPYVDPETGKRWLDPTAAERGPPTVSHGTWKIWAERSRTPFGLPLETHRVPLSRTGDHKPRSDRQFRLVISEDSVNAVRAIFDEVFGDKRAARAGNVTKKELHALEDATRRFQRPPQQPATATP